MNAITQGKTGWALTPWWLKSRDDLFRFMARDPFEESIYRRLDDAIEADDYARCLATTAGEFYCIQFRNPDRSEWVSREEYCVKALQFLCDKLCRVLHLRFRGNWRVIAEGQHGQKDVIESGDTLEEAATRALGQLDPLWKRNKEATR